MFIDMFNFNFKNMLCIHGLIRSGDGALSLDAFVLDYNKGEKNVVSLDLEKVNSKARLYLFGQVVLDRGHKSSNIPACWLHLVYHRQS